MTYFKHLKTSVPFVILLIGNMNFAQAMEESAAEEMRCASLLRQQAIDALNVQLHKQHQEQELAKQKAKIAAQTKSVKYRQKRPHKERSSKK